MRFDKARCAPAVAERRRDGYWTLIVFRCPWCGGVHRHGGGDGESPELGYKAANCNGESYSLALIERSAIPEFADVCTREKKADGGN
jgi:hypothetical protein